MPTEPAALLLRHIRKLAAPPAGAISDRELLRRFAERRDEDAFAMLLHRHGPMVLRVCRRVLPDGPDAEDAFQATFSTLARKAAAVRWHDSAAGWLYTTACNAARKVRDAAARRSAHERRAPACVSVDPLAEMSAREMLTALDEELNRLPEKYREPLVLCYLEGTAREDVAQRLGCPLGTLKGRLERGKERLRAALDQRGLSLTAALAAALVGRGSADAAVPEVLARTTLRAALLAAPAASFTAGKLAFALLLTLGLAGAGLGWAVSSTPAEPADEGAKPVADSRPPKADRHGDPLPKGAVARLGTTRFRTDTFGHLAAFSLDGKTLISVAGEYKNMTICLWDAQSGKVLRRIGGAQWNRECAALSPDQKRLATADYEGTITLWDVTAGKEVRCIQAGKHSPYSLAFSADGRKLAVSGPTEPVRILDVEEGRELLQLKGKAENASRVAFSPDGKLLATGVRTGIVCLWDAATGRLVHEWEKGHTGQNQALAFAPDGKTVASAVGDDNNIRLREVASGKEVRALACDAETHCIAFSPDGNTLAAGGWSGYRCAIRLWDLKTGKEMPRLKGHFFGVESLAFSADGKRLVSAGVDNAIRLWDPATGKELSPNADHFSWVTSVVFLPDGRTLATGGMDGTIRLWDAIEGKPLRQLEGHTDRVWRLLLSADGKMLASASEDASARLWDLATGKELRRFKDHERGVVMLALSPDGRLLATGERAGSLHIWDARTGAEVQHIVAPAVRPLGALTFSPDSKLLAGTILNLKGSPSELTLWDVAIGKEAHHWSIPSDSGYVVFSLDGRSLAVTREGPVPLSVYDVTTGKEHRRIMGPWMKMSSAPIFSPDGRMLVTITREDRAIRLWEIASGKVRRQFAGHQSALMAVAYSPDGRLLASGSTDTTALVWDVRLSGKPPAATEPDALWRRLADTDAVSAFEAIGALTTTPAQAVAVLKEHIAPAPGFDAATVERALADLDSDQFAVRRKASEELERLGEHAEPALRKTLAGTPSAEVRRQIERLLTRLDTSTLTGDRLRELRAIEALEHIGTPEARELLTRLAAGAPGARQTREAKAALERLARR